MRPLRALKVPGKALGRPSGPRERGAHKAHPPAVFPNPNLESGAPRGAHTRKPAARGLGSDKEPAARDRVLRQKLGDTVSLAIA